ncbi:autotransporter family protein [Mitsuokella multacida]|uniref:autotransporter family protein n=1 Tax=Mitsuokella multacida TaxID=52226 RepID=UPI002665DD17|nr:autotransporter outer membrane beta-barrel domain-containing protein [Mitsuokella multacida]
MKHRKHSKTYSTAQCRLMILGLVLSGTAVMETTPADAAVLDSISLVQNTSDHSDNTALNEGFGGISNRMSIEEDGTYKLDYGDQIYHHNETALLKSGGDISIDIASELNKPNAKINPSNEKQSGGIEGLRVQSGMHLHNVAIKIHGNSYHFSYSEYGKGGNQKIRGITVYSADEPIQIDQYHQENNLTVHAAAEVTAVRADSATINIGDCYIKSLVTKGNEFESGAYLANNGLYALDEYKKSKSRGVINVTGKHVYIDTNSNNFSKLYDSDDYQADVSKNDAISGKYGGTVNVNVDGTAEDVAIIGNLDAKEGTINMQLANGQSYWHGSQANYTDTKKKGTLNLSISNGAQWVPDGYQQNKLDGKADPVGTERITALTLKDGGIVNLHGFDSFIGQKTAVQELHIDELKGTGGIFRMDVNTKATPNGGRNGSDFVYVSKGEGTHYIQPVDPQRLKGLTTPVWVADAAPNVSFTGYTKKETIDEGFLYDYIPTVEKNVVVADTAQNQYGNNWYITAVKEQTKPVVPVIEASMLNTYATERARLELDSLNKRMGELRDYKDTKAGWWVRHKSGQIEGSGSSWFKNTYHFNQLGFDRQGKVDQDGRTWYGMAAHYSDDDAAYHQGHGSEKSYGASLYSSWEGNKGHYTDYVLKYSHLTNKFTAYDTTGSADGDYDNNGVTLSAEYGHKTNYQNGWMIEPQTELAYTHISGADYTMSNGIRVNQDNENSLIGRVGFRLGREYNRDNAARHSQWYVKMDLLHEFAGDHGISMTSSDASQYYHHDADGSDTWLTWGVGGNAALSDHSWAYADLEKSAAGDINTNWQVDAGIRCAF